MSRPPQRLRSPSFTNGSPAAVPPMSAPGPSSTRPLQIGRIPGRPITPNNNSIIQSNDWATPPNTAPSGPSRPQRSELRSNRVSDYGSDRASSYRDSINTTRSDISSPYSKQRNGSLASAGNDRPRPRRLKSVPSDDEAQSPSSLPSVISAFQSAGSRRRAMTNDSDDYEYQREREAEKDAERIRQQRIKEKVPGRRMNGRHQPGDIDAVLDQIRDDWDFVVDPDFNTVDLALQLLDNSSSGKDMESFRRTKHMLSKALKGSVDQYYQAFAAALPHHSSLVNHLAATQTQVEQTRTALNGAKDSLGGKRADLIQLWTRGQTLEEMMKLLDEIEHLKSVPDILETLMSEKRLLQAAVLLVRSLKLINKPDMMEIGAVADLRTYMVGQETSLREILIDELHAHLYLKSFWCESRWKVYVSNQKTLPRPDFEEDGRMKASVPVDASPLTPSFPLSRLSRFISELAMRPNDPPDDANEPGFRKFGMNSLPSMLSSLNRYAPGTQDNSQSPPNPEADSFSYMETILESLAVLGKLGISLETVMQRLPNELFSLVEATLDEVSERAEYARPESFAAISSTRVDGVYLIHDFLPLSKARLLRLSALESSTKQVNHELLRDFFWTLYSKMDAVAQGVRLIYEVANRIGSRRDFRDSSAVRSATLFPLAEVWPLVEAEIRTLIYEYLTNDDQGTVSGRNPISSINEILRDGRLNRDRSKVVFRFLDTDVKFSSKILRPHEDELNRVIKDTMPGLVQASNDSLIQSTTLVTGSEDRVLGVGQRHKLLVKPDAFLITVIMQPTLAWLDRVGDILPNGSDFARSSANVLDEFMLKVYLPQLEEKISNLFHQTVTGADAFQPDPLSKHLSSKPLTKASVQLLALINSLCVMLQTSPFHQESYSRLILGVIIQFYQRCSDRFQDLVSNIPEPQTDPQVCIAAQWAQRSELNPCLSELLNCEVLEEGRQQQYCKQETHIEMDFLTRVTLSSSDLISSTRHLASLASLYHSVSWFSAELRSLHGSETGVTLSPQSPQPLSVMSPVHFTLPPLQPEVEHELHLHLSKEMSLRFHALLKTYEQLGELMLASIRLDIRARAMHLLDSSMRHGNYSLDHEVAEPDSHILDLNSQLVEIDSLLSGRLHDKPRHFVFVGLSQLVEQLLVSNARRLRLPTPYGIKKVQRNMLALQQIIKAISADRDCELKRAKQYYAMFFQPPQDMLDNIRREKLFSFDEYQTMLNMQCGVDQTAGNPRASSATDRNYSMYMIELHGLEIEHSS